MTTADIADMLRPLQFGRLVVHYDPDNPKYPIVIALHLSTDTVVSMDPERVRRMHRPSHLTVERGGAE